MSTTRSTNDDLDLPDTEFPALRHLADHSRKREHRRDVKQAKRQAREWYGD
jgi:hypothetical protein